MKTLLFCLLAIAVIALAVFRFWVGMAWPWSAGAAIAVLALNVMLANLLLPHLSVIAWLRGLLVNDLTAVWKRWSIKIMAAQVVLISVWAAFSAIGLTPEVADWMKGAVVLVFSLAALTAAPLRQTNLPPPGGDS